MYGPGKVSLCSTRPRLLTVGSIAHIAKKNDLLAGVGARTEILTDEVSGCVVWGLRGPLTLEAFGKHGANLREIRFVGDPGLLASNVYQSEDVIPNKVIYIPHYRERSRRGIEVPSGVSLVSPDARPASIAREIQQAELILSSSLHGLVFAHSFRRPWMFVRPSSQEPLFKYRDFFHSIGVGSYSGLDSLARYSTAYKPNSSPGEHVDPSNFCFPTLAELVRYGVAEAGGTRQIGGRFE